MKTISQMQSRNAVSSNGSIFTEAASWADDLYATQLVRTAHYRLAALLLLIICFCLAGAIIVMMPLTKTELIVVHASNNGIAWVEPPLKSHHITSTDQTESEIINYINNRESYSAFAYEEQYKQVALMSSTKVAEEYLQEQSISNKNSPVLQLGEEGQRKVTIESIIFLDEEKQNKEKHEKQHKNLAQIHFTSTTSNKGKKIATPYVALLSWDYRGTPTEPEAKWKNWDGFTVTQYNVTQRSLAK